MARPPSGRQAVFGSEEPFESLPNARMESASDRQLHVVFVGDSKIGQSTVLKIFRRDEDLAARPSESFVLDLELEDTLYTVRITDQSGQECFQQRWPLRARNDEDGPREGTLGSAVQNTADVVALCFSTASRESLENAEHVHLKNYRSLRKKGKLAAPCVLVGLQTDLRDDQGGVQTMEAIEVAERLECAGYLECSAMLPHGCSDAVMKLLLTAREFHARKAQRKRVSMGRRAESDQTLEEFAALSSSFAELARREVEGEMGFRSLDRGIPPDPMMRPGAAEQSITLDEDTCPLQKHAIVAGLSCLGLTPSQRHAYLRCEVLSLKLTSCMALRGFEHLQDVNVSDNRLRSLDFLDGLPFLLHLNASRNLLTSVQTFATPRQLESVDLSYNLLGELGSWDVHRYLKRLILRANFLEFLGTGLAMCTHLRLLDLGNNALQEVEGLAHLPLAELYLGHNQLTSVSGLRGLRELRVLDVSGNQLRTLEEMSASEHPLLLRLDVRGNMLAHRKRIEPLEHFPYLSDLFVSPNPVDQLPYYRLQLLQRLKTLRSLDGSPATAEEKVKASVLYGEEVEEQRQIFESVLPRETFTDRRFVKAEDLDELEQKQFGQIGGYLDEVGDTTELYA